MTAVEGRVDSNLQLWVEACMHAWTWRFDAVLPVLQLLLLKTLCALIHDVVNMLIYGSVHNVEPTI
jgi:hypothetical protein